MKLLVGLDEDGHFFVIKYEDKSKTFITLTTDPNFKDLLSDSSNKEYDEIMKMNEEEYEHFIYSFISRGRLEIIEI